MTVAAVGALLWAFGWSRNDRTTAGYPFNDVTATVTLGTDPGGTAVLRFRGEGWTGAQPLEILRCGELGPGSCEVLLVEPIVTNGTFDVSVVKTREDTPVTLDEVTDTVRQDSVYLGEPGS